LLVLSCYSAVRLPQSVRIRSLLAVAAADYRDINGAGETCPGSARNRHVTRSVRSVDDFGPRQIFAGSMVKIAHGENAGFGRVMIMFSAFWSYRTIVGNSGPLTVPVVPDGNCVSRPDRSGC